MPASSVAGPGQRLVLYVPLSSQYSEGVNNDFWLLGIGFIEISAIAQVVEVLVGIMKTRAVGMSIDRLPIYAWYILVTALMIVLRLSAADPGRRAAGSRARFRLAVLRCDARRRPAAVAASVLVLRPPGGLHHLPAGGGPCLDDPADVHAGAAGRIHLGGAGRHRDRRSSASGCGSTTCSRRACRTCR